MNEDAIQQHVVHLMRSYGREDVCYFAVANGEARSLATGAKLKRQGVIAGAPDMVFVVDGFFYGLELKTDSGRLSPSQSEFGDWIKSAGGTYLVAHGLEEAVRLLKQMKAFRPNINFTFPTTVADGRSGVRERPWKQILRGRKRHISSSEVNAEPPAGLSDQTRQLGAAKLWLSISLTSSASRRRSRLAA